VAAEPNWPEIESLLRGGDKKEADARLQTYLDSTPQGPQREDALLKFLLLDVDARAEQLRGRKEILLALKLALDDKATPQLPPWLNPEKLVNLLASGKSDEAYQAAEEFLDVFIDPWVHGLALVTFGVAQLYALQCQLAPFATAIERWHAALPDGMGELLAQQDKLRSEREVDYREALEDAIPKAESPVPFLLYEKYKEHLDRADLTLVEGAAARISLGVAILTANAGSLRQREVAHQLLKKYAVPRS
jgi:hypothetical protein